MRVLSAIFFCLCLAVVSPVHADSHIDQPQADESEGFFGLIDRMLRGFLDDVDPHMRRMERDFQALEPELRGLLGRLRDMVEYEPPEILPNGDILIRRRPAAPDNGETPDQADPPDPAAPEGTDGASPPLEL